MTKDRNRRYDTHTRRGYRVIHSMQRTTNGQSHHFTVHDHGAPHLPKLRHLIRMFVPAVAADGKRLTIINAKSGTSSTRSFWYAVDIQYRRS